VHDILPPKTAQIQITAQIKIIHLLYTVILIFRSACINVCLSVCLPARMFRKPHVQISPNLLYISPWEKVSILKYFYYVS